MSRAVAVLRPEPGNAATAAAIEAAGLTAIRLPLFEIHAIDWTPPDVTRFDALLLTSANAVRALADRGVVAQYAQLPVLAVGDRTAQEAEEAGFGKVSSAAGALNDLVNAIAISKLKGPLFHPTGRHQSGDLAKALAPLGVMVATAKIYDMVAIEALPADILAALSDGSISAVLAYSRRTAEIFAALAAGLELSQRRRIAMLCLSEAVAGPLLEAHFHRISLADRPDEDAMMALALAVAREQTGP